MAASPSIKSVRCTISPTSDIGCGHRGPGRGSPRPRSNSFQCLPSKALASTASNSSYPSAMSRASARLSRLAHSLRARSGKSSCSQASSTMPISTPVCRKTSAIHVSTDYQIQFTLPEPPSIRFGWGRSSTTAPVAMIRIKLKRGAAQSRKMFPATGRRATKSIIMNTATGTMTLRCHAPSGFVGIP
jgi:hypothetical protein